MYRTEKETSKVLRILLIVSFVFLAIYIFEFILFADNADKTGDADLKDFGAVFSYHFGNFGDLFTFKLNASSNVFYVALSGLLYGLIAIVVIFLIEFPFAVFILSLLSASIRITADLLRYG